MRNEEADDTIFLDPPRSESSYSSISGGRSATGHSDSDDDDYDRDVDSNRQSGGGNDDVAVGAPTERNINNDDDQNNSGNDGMVITHDYGFKGWLIRTFSRHTVSSGGCLRGRQKVRIDDGNGYRMVDPGLFHDANHCNVTSYRWTPSLNATLM